MPIWLKQSTASQEIPLGYFLDSTDGNTAETGLTIANTDIKVWKSGATTLANKNSGGATHIAGGVYYATLDATDTNTLGPLVIFVHVSGALAVRVECLVVPTNVYDSLVAGSDNLQVDTIQWLGTACATPTVAGVPEVDVTHVSGAAEDISTETKQDIIDANVDAILVDTADMQPKLGTPVTSISADIATVDSNVDAILVDTNELQTDWTNAGRLDAILDSILAMLDDPRGEPAQGAPGVSVDAMTKIDYLYKAWRNKVEQTSTTMSIYNDAGTVVDHKSTVSDSAGTATKGEIVSGP